MQTQRSTVLYRLQVTPVWSTNAVLHYLGWAKGWLKLWRQTGNLVFVRCLFGQRLKNVENSIWGKGKRSERKKEKQNSTWVRSRLFIGFQGAGVCMIWCLSSSFSTDQVGWTLSPPKSDRMWLFSIERGESYKQVCSDKIASQQDVFVVSLQTKTGGKNICLAALSSWTQSKNKSSPNHILFRNLNNLRPPKEKVFVVYTSFSVLSEWTNETNNSCSLWTTRCWTKDVFTTAKVERK